MKEIYKEIEGYEGIYEVSNMGNVKSLYKNNILTPKKHNITNNYVSLAVALYKNKIQKEKVVARLVAETFIPNPENKPCVNHIDNNPLNNNINNLEWVTHKENTAHIIDSGRFKKIDIEKIEGIKNMHRDNFTINEIAKEYDCSNSNIIYILKTHYKNYISKNKLLHDSKVTDIQKYLNQGMSVVEIATLYNCSTKNIYIFIKRNNIYKKDNRYK